MELNDAIRTTFSARDYTGEELSDETLYDILETARFAPSGGNRQGNRVIIVRDQATKDRISDLNIPAAKRYVAQVKAGENPWNAVVPTTVPDAEIEATEPVPLLTEPFKTASAVLVFLVDLRVVASVDQYLDRIGIISGASIYPFVWNVLLLARQAGYGGTITTLAVTQEPAMRELLGIPEDFGVCAVVPLGKPVKQLTKLRRLSVEELATCERFDGETFAKP
ncbi:MAG: nitroreductase family protein [Rhodospirillaceae bacterium]|nr:nitroreductase family protein [Rhodospirillaceae bacterium]MDD9925252.1 nitroreductase family protein [Rhodospirillaceae bacterium]